MLKVPVTPADHIRGNIEAPNTLIEYGDYECGFCGLAHPIVLEVMKYFGNDLRFVFRNFPLTQIHPHAELAAETAEFAGDFGHYWEMHDLIYENQNRLGLELLLELGEYLGLSPSEYEKAIQNRVYTRRVKEDFMSGVHSGVNGTPTFFINGQRHNGSYEFESLVKAIKQAKKLKAA